MDAAFYILGVFFILMLLGVPIAVNLGVAGISALFIFDLGYQSVGVNFISGIASFPLLAIPFFVLSGVILDRAGFAARIAKLFELLVSGLPGGLAMVTVGTCMFWGALSGSGPATTAAVGFILLAPMVKNGYDKNFAAATIANASDISIIIPPSIAFIIYGNLTGTSVSALFAAGVLPGILVGAGILAVAAVISAKRGYGKAARGKRAPGELSKALKESVWALLAPVIILGGIYAGVFTPTEAAVVAVVYSLFVGMVLYRTVRFGDLVAIFVDAGVTSAVIMTIVVFAGYFSLAASTIGVIDSLTNFILTRSADALTTILMINLLLLVLGMFLDAISISYLIMPVLMPVLAKFGIDPVWYGVIFITALAIGQTTPPVGVNLFTAANLAETDIDSVSKAVVPYVCANVAALVILSLFPSISLFLPQLLGF
ncbi:MAG: TRAP transporter large permease [Kiritimatiellaeota bacterium]|nr:TRAP transporter large permease [Kiritimatiellota bacterium]